MNLSKRTTILFILLIGLSAALRAQAPAWSQAVQYPFAMGGDSGAGGPAAAVFNGVVYLVFTTRQAAPSGDYYMWEATSSDGLHYSNPTTIYTQGGSPAHASSNPALAVYNNTLYLAYNNAQGAQLVTSSDGSTWGAVQQVPAGPVNYSPALAAFNGLLYVGLKEYTSVRPSAV